MLNRLVSFLALASLTCTPLAAARTQATSWGKSGVSMDQYRRDAGDCGRAGYYLDVSQTEAAQVFKRATGQLQANETNLTSAEAKAPEIMNIVTTSAHIVAEARPDEHMKQVGNLMQSTVDDCLKQRGYVRFKLTDPQRKHLGHLHLGSPERRAYLYQLATDAKLLAAQTY